MHQPPPSIHLNTCRPIRTSRRRQARDNQGKCAGPAIVGCAPQARINTQVMGIGPRGGEVLQEIVLFNSRLEVCLPKAWRANLGLTTRMANMALSEEELLAGWPEWHGGCRWRSWLARHTSLARSAESPMERQDRPQRDPWCGPCGTGVGGCGAVATCFGLPNRLRILVIRRTLTRKETVWSEAISRSRQPRLNARNADL